MSGPKIPDHVDELNFVAGRAHGIIGVLLVLAETHPDPQMLLAEIEKLEQAALAMTEPTQLSDEYIEGMRDVIDRVRATLARRLQSASPGRRD